jgi:hypothetical protein
VILLISLVGGPDHPALPLNWLKKRGELDLPASFGGLDEGLPGLWLPLWQFGWSPPAIL